MWLEGMGSKRWGPNPVDTVLGLDLVVGVKGWEMGSKWFRSTCSGEVPAGAVRRTAAVSQVTVGAAVIGCKRLMGEG